MENSGFYVIRENMKYEMSNRAISNRFEENYSAIETASVHYLNMKYSDEIYLPITLFKNNLTPLQTIVKYLREELREPNKQIAGLLNRDPKTTWLTYKAIEKKKKLVFGETRVLIPISIFTDRRLSVFEALVTFLKNLELKYSEISNLLDRDQRTIWTIHSRAKKKLDNSNLKPTKNGPGKE